MSVRFRKGKSSRKKVKNDNKTLSSFDLMFFFVLGVLLFFIAYVEGEHLWKICHNVFLGMFGVLAIAIGPVYIFMSIFYAIKNDKPFFKTKIYEFFLLLLIICAIVQIYDFEEATANLGFFERLQQLKIAWNLGLQSSGGGAVGEFLSIIFSYFFGRQVAFLIFWLLFFILLFLASEVNFVKFVQFLIKPLKNSKLNSITKNDKVDQNVSDVKNLVEGELEKGQTQNKGLKAAIGDVDVLGSEFINLTDNEKKNKISDENFTGLADDLNNDIINKKNEILRIDKIKNESKIEHLNDDDYQFPSIDLLNQQKVDRNFDLSNELKVNASRLVDTLKSFGVETRIINISKGPTVTRYELQPSAGVKISKITNLADDISLNLAAGGVRIEAPIPNKAAVGIEVPNKKKEIVFLREIIASDVFKNAKSRLTVALGKDIAGNVVVADLAKMPHILIAGATGSGKSVCVNSLIVSLIYKSSPQSVKLLLIDPKVVELGVYNEIAHLLIPVVTDPKKAAGALNWAVNEMLKRYKLFAQAGVRDLKSYNFLMEKKLNSKLTDQKHEKNKLPQIVIVIDELADLMMAASKEVENAICRLAQMARAAGMHLVIATQRPSVAVITGLIKANVPSRIAFTVSSQVDSRTIIDLSGAEKLLGKGDMLYFPLSEQKPTRVQGCFLSDDEVERVVNFVKVKETSSENCYSNEILEEIKKHVENSENSEHFEEKASESLDPLFNSAVELVLNSDQASTSFLQRKLKVGYSRAARIMDEMEQLGIISKPTGSKARKILISRQQFLDMKLNRGD